MACDISHARKSPKNERTYGNHFHSQKIVAVSLCRLCDATDFADRMRSFRTESNIHTKRRTKSGVFLIDNNQKSNSTELDWIKLSDKPASLGIYCPELEDGIVFYYEYPEDRKPPLRHYIQPTMK